MLCPIWSLSCNLLQFLLFFSLLTNFLLSELFARRLKLKILDRNKSQHTIRHPNKSQHSIRDPNKSQHSIRDPNKSQRLIRDPNIFTFPEVDRALRRESASAVTKRAPSFDRRGREIHREPNNSAQLRHRIHSIRIDEIERHLDLEFMISCQTLKPHLDPEFGDSLSWIPSNWAQKAVRLMVDIVWQRMMTLVKFCPLFLLSARDDP